MNIRYTCGVFALPQDSARDWKVLMTRPDPTVSGRRAIMFPIEGDQRWILGLGGVNGDSAPTDIQGFLDYARSLRTPTAYNAIRAAELQGELTRFAFPKSFRRHFERMMKFPRGLLPIADSICRMNPSFGQGMSVAAKEAVLLGEVLHGLSYLPDPLIDLVPAFFERLDTVLGDPWAVAAQDYVYEHLANERPPEFAEKLKFQAALTRLAAEIRSPPIDDGGDSVVETIEHLAGAGRGRATGSSDPGRFAAMTCRAPREKLEAHLSRKTAWAATVAGRLLRCEQAPVGL